MSDFLRHVVATLAYRGEKAVRGAPPEFSGFCAREGVRSPVQILAHIGDLLDWTLHLADGEQVWRESAPLRWDEEKQRFFAALSALDARLASGAPLKVPAENLFQGPISDAFTHIGQISMLRRIRGSPVRGENYFKADIASGRVGPEQVPPRREFD